FAPENPGKVLVIGAKLIGTTDGQDNVLPAQSRQPLGLMLVGNICAGIVEIDLAIRATVGEAADVVETAHADDAIDQLRMTKGKVDGVIGAEAGPGGEQEGVGIAAGGEGQRLALEVEIVLCVAAGTLLRRELPRVPAFTIYAVDAKQLDPALLQMVTQRVDHAKVFPLVEAPL